MAREYRIKDAVFHNQAYYKMLKELGYRDEDFYPDDHEVLVMMFRFLKDKIEDVRISNSSGPV